MKIPIQWLRDYVDIELDLEQLAHRLTMTGLEVEGITLVGLPKPQSEKLPYKIEGLSWPADKFVVAEILEVFAHPNADRLVLCTLNDGSQELTVLTGAPDLYPYKGLGKLEKPIKVAYAREGAQLYDGHQAGQVLTTLKRTKIRGVDSFSMVCSEKELGISEEHEGIIHLDDDAPVGMPLADYMGDAVFEVAILPNMVRNASMIGVAREIAAMTGKPLRLPDTSYPTAGESIEGKVGMEIKDPDRNPRFMLGMVRNVTSKPSPYWVQRRLRLAGMRPINGIVDATNYVMLETGQPLHAFDYDTLVHRAGESTPTIITRAAADGEKLTTLDNVVRNLSSYTTLVADTAGALSLAGVMGGLESEVLPDSHTILLEAAAWNLINTRKTITAHKLNSEAGYRFSRSVHPNLSELGLKVGLKRLAEWSGGSIAPGIIDNHPKPYPDPEVALPTTEVKRILGLDLSPTQIAELLNRLEFSTRIEGETVHAKAPSHRMDIGTNVYGQADLIEEIARLYGYENIPAGAFADEMPPVHDDKRLTTESRIKDLLTYAGLQEVITYRFSSPEREKRIRLEQNLLADEDYVVLQNPISTDRRVMRRSLLTSVLEVMEHNIRLAPGLAFYEVGPQFIPQANAVLPTEEMTLCIALTGLSQEAEWDRSAGKPYDFYDLKGILDEIWDSLHIADVRYQPTAQEPYHPGRAAAIYSGETLIGSLGDLHPVIQSHFDLGAHPLITAEINISLLTDLVPAWYASKPVNTHPPVLEALAVIVDESIAADQVLASLKMGGGKLLREIRLFDVFRGAQVGEGKKSLAYNLTYQADDHTLNEKDAANIRNRIIRRLQQDLGATIRTA